jgi:hypothetical protein
MLRVYLDQNKWIDLARADLGKNEAGRDVLDVAKEAAKLGIASFPLSAIHYMETWNTHSAKRRRDLASTLLKLTRPGSSIGPDTMADPPVVLPMELDVALQRRFGRPLTVRRCAVFGEGIGHAFGRPPVRYEASSNLPLSREQRSSVEYHASRLLEAEALAGPRVDLPVPGVDMEGYRKPSQAYVDGEKRQVELFKEIRASREQRARYLAAGSLLDILQPLNDALFRAGIKWDELTSLSADEMTDFLRDIPTRHVGYELHCLQHENPELPRGLGDLLDVAALRVAVVYCDAVVTERFWARLIRRAGLDKEYGTTVLSDVRDLMPLLLAAR